MLFKHSQAEERVCGHYLVILPYYLEEVFLQKFSSQSYEHIRQHLFNIIHLKNIILYR